MEQKNIIMAKQKVKFIKPGTMVGLGYSENETAEISENLAEELASVGIVKFINKTPENKQQQSVEAAEKSKKTIKK